jgi:hypothetical protein
LWAEELIERSAAPDIEDTVILEPGRFAVDVRDVVPEAVRMLARIEKQREELSVEAMTDGLEPFVYGARGDPGRGCFSLLDLIRASDTSLAVSRQQDLAFLP